MPHFYIRNQKLSLHSRHVVPEEIQSGQIPEGETVVATAGGEEITVTRAGDSVTVTRFAAIHTFFGA